MRNKLKTGRTHRKPAAMAADLKTEFPLCEKDEQAVVIERLRKMQITATLRWRELHKNKK